MNPYRSHPIEHLTKDQLLVLNEMTYPVDDVKLKGVSDHIVEACGAGWGRWLKVRTAACLAAAMVVLASCAFVAGTRYSDQWNQWFSGEGPTRAAVDVNRSAKDDGIVVSISSVGADEFGAYLLIGVKDEQGGRVSGDTVSLGNMLVYREGQGIRGFYEYGVEFVGFDAESGTAYFGAVVRDASPGERVSVRVVGGQPNQVGALPPGSWELEFVVPDRAETKHSDHQVALDGGVRIDEVSVSPFGVMVRVSNQQGDPSQFMPYAAHAKSVEYSNGSSVRLARSYPGFEDASAEAPMLGASEEDGSEGSFFTMASISNVDDIVAVTIGDVRVPM